jgi:hypothetical protein
MFVLRSAALVFICGALVTLAVGTVVGGGTAPAPAPPPPPPPAPAPLDITSFKAVSSYGMIYTFSGTVTGGDGSVTNIYFGDSPTMTGRWCEVQEDGSFSLTIELTTADYGPVSAQAINQTGEMSEIDYVYVLAE